MCNQVTLLVAHDDHRFIGICEHGTLHISWGHIIIYMKPEDFLSLDYCLNRAIVENRLFVENKIGKAAMLWIFNTAVLLKEEDFLIICSMVALSAKRLTVHVPRHPNPAIRLDEDVPFRTVAINNNYRLN